MTIENSNRIVEALNSTVKPVLKFLGSGNLDIKEASRLANEIIKIKVV